MNKDDNIDKVDSLEMSAEEEKTTSNNNDKKELKKKMIMLMGIILGGFILILLILAIFSLFSSKSYSYDDLEKVLKNAAVSYFKDNKKSLPNSDDQTVEIDSSVLIASEYMKEFSEYRSDADSCSGKVIVQKSDDTYSYTPYLTCGDDYITEALYQVITKKTVNTGAGLYKVANSYVYRGEEVNNYVKLDNALWRIVRVTADKKIELVLNSDYNYSYPWDDRYNNESGYNSGNNDYSASRIKSYLGSIYKDNDEGTYILSANDRTKLAKFSLCIGKRTSDSTDKEGTVECSNKVNDQKIGLLTVSDYINASLDSNCINSTSYSCQNYNYLVTDFDWWLATAVEGSTDNVFAVDSRGVVVEESASAYMSVRPVIYLNDTNLFKSGTGTAKKPYRIK